MRGWVFVLCLYVYVVCAFLCWFEVKDWLCDIQPGFCVDLAFVGSVLAYMGESMCVDSGCSCV